MSKPTPSLKTICRRETCMNYYIRNRVKLNENKRTKYKIKQTELYIMKRKKLIEKFPNNVDEINKYTNRKLTYSYNKFILGKSYERINKNKINKIEINSDNIYTKSECQIVKEKK